MTAQELKNSILQLAVQGKLVQQCKDDEPASELLKQILAEKKKLGIKEKSLPEITEEEKPFDIPDSWEWVRLGVLGILKSGYAFKSTEYINKGIQVVRISDLGDDCILSKSPVFYKESQDLQQYLITQDSFLICMTGSIGKMAWVKDAEKRYLNQRVGMFELSDKINKKYVWMFLHSAYVVSKLVGTKTSLNGNIKNSDINELLVSVPPLAEQKRIVAKIEELMPLIEEYGKAEEQLSKLNAEFPDKLRKSILQQAVQGKLTERDPADEPAFELLKRIKAEKEALIKSGKIKKEKPLPTITDDEKPFDIPDTWEWVRLSDICNISDGTHQTPTYVEHGIPFISAQNVKPYRFLPENHRNVSYEDYLEYNKNISPEKGDILMARVGAGIGEAAIIDQDLEFSIYVSLTLIKCYSKEFDMLYLLHVLNSPIGRKLAEKKTLGKGASQGNLNLIFIREFVLPIPPITEQKRIVKRVEELLALCDELK